jgi:hypothetical protein
LGCSAAFLAAEQPKKYPAVVSAKVYQGRPTPLDLLVVSISENDARKDHNPVDRAFNIKRLKKEGGLTSEQVAEILHCTRQSITHHLRLLDPLLEKYLPKIASGQWPMYRALNWLDSQKKGNDGESQRVGPDNNQPRRFPSTGMVMRIYQMPKRPEIIQEEEWKLWTDDKVRRLIASVLGIDFKPYARVLEEFKKAEEEREALNKKEAERAAALKKEAEEAKETAKAGKEESTAPVETSDGKKTVPQLTVKRARAVSLFKSLGKGSADGWKNDTLASKMESIVNMVEEGQVVPDALKKLLQTLIDGYANGLKVVVKD